MATETRSLLDGMRTVQQLSSFLELLLSTLVWPTRTARRYQEINLETRHPETLVELGGSLSWISRIDSPRR